MPRPLHALIDPAAMQHNLALLRKALPRTRIWAVAKAAAYGHGLEAAVDGFGQADGLAVIEPEAALLLRRLGWTKRLLLMEGVFDAEDLQACSCHAVDVVVHSPWQLQPLRVPDPPGAKLPRVWLKANLGMNRLGYTPQEALQTAMQLLEGGQACGVMAHFANADREGGDPAAESRAADWVAAARAIAPNLEVSLANSAAALRLADLAEPTMSAVLAGDWIRSGIALYGASPFEHCSASSLGLKPAMALYSRILAVQALRPGESVGYGSRFVAQSPTRIGIVAAGYADGYPRHAPNGTPVWVDGQRCPLAGRVSMDLLTVDLSAHPHAKVGSPVQLWGEHLPVDEVARASGTIGYELLCALAPRVTRRICALGHGR